MKAIVVDKNSADGLDYSIQKKIFEENGIEFVLEDGSNLFNNAFAVNNPRLAINSLQTPSERNAQNGLKEMLNGVTHMVRNVTAHELKIKWIVNEQDLRKNRRSYSHISFR